MLVLVLVERHINMLQEQHRQVPKRQQKVFVTTYQSPLETLKVSFGLVTPSTHTLFERDWDEEHRQDVRVVQNLMLRGVKTLFIHIQRAIIMKDKIKRHKTGQF